MSGHRQPLVEPEEAPVSESSSVHELPKTTATSDTLIYPVLAVVLLVNLAASLYQLPLNRVVEKRLCEDHYSRVDPSVIRADATIPESECKIDEVQQALGRIQGAVETAWVVGDFLVTIPLSVVTELYGKRLVLRLNIAVRVFMLSWAVLVGYYEYLFPIRAIVIGPMLSVLGGDCVFNSLVFTLVSGSTDSNLDRANYFGYVSSVSYAVALIGPALASATMSRLLWLPFWIGISLLLCALPLLSRIPDHAVSKHSRRNSGDGSSVPLLPSSPDATSRGDQLRSLFGSFVDRAGKLRSSLAKHPRNFTIMLVCFFLTSLASSDTKLLVQYISLRYGWTFASAGYLLSGKAIVNFLLLTVVVPRLLRHLSRGHARSPQATQMAADKQNVFLAKVCLCVSEAGALAIGFSDTTAALVPSLLTYALGSALPVFTLSLLRSPSVCIQPDGNAASADAEMYTFSIVMLVKTLGSLVGAPLMAVLWVSGIGVGGGALGVPYFVSGACYVVAMVVFSKLRF